MGTLVHNNMETFYHIYHFLDQVVTQPQGCSEITDMLTVDSVQEALKGVFKTKDELDNYERIWHYGIYLPTWNELRSKVRLSEEVH